MKHPLYVAFVWHMHQPMYVSPDDRSTAVLPWVRLHAAKDYLHMAEVLARFPSVHATFNVVPSLLRQIEQFVSGRVTDRLWQISLKKEWSREEKLYLLNVCFGHDPNRVISLYPRYRELFLRKAKALQDPESFSNQDYRDLIAWFNLTWIDLNWLESDPELSRLMAKERGFTLQEISLVHAKQLEIARKIIPTYRNMQERGQIEVSTTPLYHPILPLLMDTDSAREATPDIRLPRRRFSFPQDAEAQLELAKKVYRLRFGDFPRGLWPSEGAVSHDLLRIVGKQGFRWFASDEGVLGKSLGTFFSRDGHGFVQEPRKLYHPYWTIVDGKLGPVAVFRDHELSDRIGFVYHSWPGAQAAEDLTIRLRMIRDRIDDPEHPYLVSIILDGENCWEGYEHNGDVFLESLYERLSKEETIRTVTVSEYLDRFGARDMLAHLATGSWIRADLTTWIGDPEHDIAWSLLAQAREDFEKWAEDHKGSKFRKARTSALDALHVAEGSDWFWWYSSRNTSDQDDLYDELFRGYLRASYEARGEEPPSDLDVPIQGRWQKPKSHPPRYTIAPDLRGEAALPDDWRNAGVLLPENSTGAMQRSDGIIRAFYFGTDSRNLYMRLELDAPLQDFVTTIHIACDKFIPWNITLRYSGKEVNARIGWAVESQYGRPPFLYKALGYDEWQSIGPVHHEIGTKVMEVALPLHRIGLDGHEEIRFLVSVTSADGRQEALIGEPMPIFPKED